MLLLQVMNFYKPKYFLFFFLLTIFSLNGSCAIFQSTGSGDWDDISSWNLGSIPNEDDTITIQNSHTINIPPGYTTRFMKLIIDNGGILNISSGGIFYFWTTNTIPVGSRIAVLENNGSITGTCELNIASKAYISGNGLFGSGISLKVRNDLRFVDNAVMTINGNILIQGGADFIIESGSDLTINTIYSINGASWVKNYGTLRLNSNAVFDNYAGESSNNVFHNYSGSTVEYLPSSGSSGDFPTPNMLTTTLEYGPGFHNLIISGNADCNEDFTVYGNWTNSSTFTSSSSGNNITFGGTSTQIFTGSGINNFKKLTLNNPSGLNMTGGTINIEEVMESSSGTFTQNGSDIILISNSGSGGFAGTVKVNNASDYSYSSGTFTSQRYYSAANEGWRMISSPVKNSTLSDVDDEFIFCGILPVTGNNYSASSCGTFHNVLTYNTANTSYNEITSMTQSISGGSGTLIYTGSGNTQLIMSNDGTRSPNFDDIIPIGLTTSGDAFNLISNPYPATLSWGLLHGASDISAGGYYVYEADGGGFQSRTSDIASNQGFFVQATGPNLNFQVNQTTNAYNTTFRKSINGINLPLNINISSDSLDIYDNTYLISDQNFSNSYDSAYELKKLFSSDPDYFTNIYFVDSSNNFLDRIFIGNMESNDLFFNTNVGKYAHGNYTLRFNNLSQFMIGSCISLEDLNNGIITNLRLDSTYNFVSDSLSPNPRFKLSIEKDYNIEVTNPFCYEENSGLIKLNGTSLNGSYFNLIDSSGQLIDSIYSQNDTIIFYNLTSGIYNLETNHTGRCSMSSQEIILIDPEEVIANFHIPFDTIYLDSLGFCHINFNNLSSGASSYYWDFGDGNFSNDFAGSNTYYSPGNYTIELVAENNLGNCRDTFNIQLFIADSILSFNDILNEDIFINYNQNELKITSSNNSLINNHFQIFDVNGTVVFNEKIKLNYQTFNISNLKSGYYIFSIFNKESPIVNRKFLKID